MVKQTATTTEMNTGATATKTGAKATKSSAKATKSSAKTTKASAKATKSDTKSATKESSTTPVTELAPQTTTPEETVTTPSVMDQFSGFMVKLQAFSSQFSAIKTEFRSLERIVNRELKAAAKSKAKRARKAVHRAPSGFVKPTLISTELATFLGKPNGTEMARTEVTREINAYIREHKLQDAKNGRRIHADKKLTGLLKLTKEDELTYFNLQKYMSCHFAKAGDKTAPNTNTITV
jgi:chromatin remodeling complex protein RSC6